MRSNGIIDNYEAKLMILGFYQTKCVDYFGTYSPMTKIRTIRTLITLVAIHDLVVHQMDVKIKISKYWFKGRGLYDSTWRFCDSTRRRQNIYIDKVFVWLKKAPREWYEK